MCCSTVYKRASGIKIILCALHFQPGEVWSRVNPHSLALSLSVSENTIWYFDKLTCARSDPFMAWQFPSFAAFFAAWSANWLPFIIRVSPFWWPGRCIIATCEGLWTVSKSDRISEACFMSLLFKVRHPFLSRLSHEHAPWRVHSESLWIYFLACPQWEVGLLSEQWFLPSELSSLGAGLLLQQSF